MNLKEIVTGTAIVISASLGAASNAEAQFPSTCMPATCGPKIATVWEERIVTKNVMVPGCEQREITYKVPRIVFEERKGIVNVPTVRCEQRQEKQYFPRQVCVEQPQACNPCAPACEQPCAPSNYMFNTCGPKPLVYAPRTCEPRCNNWYLGKYLGEAINGIERGVNSLRIEHTEKKLERLYSRRDRINEHSNQCRAPGYGYGRTYGYRTLPGFNSVIQGSAVYAAPACSAPCTSNAYSAPGYAPSWNQGFSTPYAPMPAQQSAPMYQQQSAPEAIPSPPMPMPDATPQGSQRGFKANSVALDNDGWMPARE